MLPETKSSALISVKLSQVGNNRQWSNIHSSSYSNNSLTLLRTLDQPGIVPKSSHVKPHSLTMRYMITTPFYR